MIGAALAVVLATGLVACSANDDLADDYNASDGESYASVSDRFITITEEDRAEPVSFSGTTEDGEDFDSADIAGDVTVVNFWYANCGPCRLEAKDLETVWQDFEGDGVSFVGVNIYDQADTARAFSEKFGITYPSIMDADSGAVKLAFAEQTPIQAPPNTLVLDKQGRVAARIIGPIDVSILSTLVKEALAESV